ncbi:putative olfactory receptor 10J6 [Phacochoerus africanus]|uniref:putative olfactory receptor 10J6 n=1 Tax=Phacochoerus africanus TaxID=41426 RepID=UPI001FDA3BE9|nr:putative olfactory receptor 10J6 [Phacochoerus africanus]
MIACYALKPEKSTGGFQTQEETPLRFSHTEPCCYGAQLQSLLAGLIKRATSRGTGGGRLVLKSSLSSLTPVLTAEHLSQPISPGGSHPPIPHTSLAPRCSLRPLFSRHGGHGEHWCLLLPNLFCTLKLRNAEEKNLTEVTEFIFLGFSRFHEHQITLFVVFLILYTLTLAGNAIIVTIIHMDRHLHTPMYFFLSTLASSETMYTLVIIPRMLTGLTAQNQPISLAGCTTQMFFFVTLAINNCFLLTVMGYDRYVAICNPLRYMVIMSKRVCVQLMCGAFGIGLAMAAVQVTSIFTLPFCHRVVGHFFCDILPVMKLSCIDTTINEIINFVVSLFVILVPMGLVFISYVLIISTILKIASAEGRKKAFATCASHLTVVIVHYGCASIAYLKPKSENSVEQDLLLSVTYTTVTPLLNPVVYSLRNKEVKEALCRAVSKNIS